jgi:septum formation protein
MRLVLASASPRRAEILRNAGFVFSVSPTDVDETLLPREAAGDFVQRLATLKAHVAAEQMRGEIGQAIVIGADTVVVVDGQTLGKPTGAEDAGRMLRLLSGQKHEVLTGLSVLSVPEGPEAHHVESTRVTFVRLGDEDIDDYLATGEPFGKAGAYAIQGVGGRFVSRIEGCYFNVMGLPLSRLWCLLRSVGWKDSGGY